MTEVRTGIEVEFVPNDMQKLIGNVLHFFHLELGEAIFKASHLLVAVDGERQELPLALKTFVATLPGTHTIEVAMKGPLSLDAPSRWYYGATVQVDVPQSGVVRLQYSLNNIMNPIGFNGNLAIAE